MKNPYQNSIEDVLEHLDTRQEGLSKDEAENRLEDHGKNRLPEEKPPALWLIFLQQFKDPLIYILLIAGIVALSMQRIPSAIFIFIVLLINAVIGTAQEYSATRAAAALKKMASPVSRVRRDDESEDIDSENLVPGDIVILESGDKVPADLRLMSSEDLRADESVLTGESEERRKEADQTLEEDTPLAERGNMVFAGSMITKGRAEGIVCTTGTHTEMGRIAKDVTMEATSKSPLAQRMEAFTAKIAVALLFAVSLIAWILYWRGAPMEEIVLMSIGLAVSAIPAGLPVALTIALANGMQRMAKRDVIVRKLVAVESLGSCTLIASDKTGTLTRNELTAERVVLADGQEYEISAGDTIVEGEFERV